jgi:hypothetical protein
MAFSDTAADGRPSDLHDETAVSPAGRRPVSWLARRAAAG